MELTINHLEYLKESNLDFNQTIKLLDYLKRQNRFDSVLIITNILQGSYISSTDNIQPGLIIKKINEREVSNLKEFREAFLNPFKLNSKYYFILETENFNKIIVEIIKINEEELSLSERYNYKISNLSKSINYDSKKYLIET